jgi:hypothetical protein
LEIIGCLRKSKYIYPPVSYKYILGPMYNINDTKTDYSSANDPILRSKGPDNLKSSYRDDIEEGKLLRVLFKPFTRKHISHFLSLERGNVKLMHRKESRRFIRV